MATAAARKMGDDVERSTVSGLESFARLEYSRPGRIPKSLVPAYDGGCKKNSL
jgi:hypothetical protein